MKGLLLILCCFAMQVCTAQIQPQVRAKTAPPGDPGKFWLFVLAGQSNMAGRGLVEPADTLPNAQVLSLNKEGEWEIAKDPVHFDRPYAAVGPGLSFGKAMAATDSSIYIGLIPCAVGGSGIDSWRGPNGNQTAGENYEQAVARCRNAMQNGVFKGILWNQGETDCSEKGVQRYEEKLLALIEALRNDLGDSTLPFIAAELPAFQVDRPDSTHQFHNNPYVDLINAKIKSLKNRVHNYDVISSEHTDHKGDYLHYNSTSARLLGLRYAAAMRRMTSPLRH